MQASLKDMALSRHDSESFLICQRILHECHEIIYGGTTSATPYSALQILRLPGSRRRKVKPLLLPAIVGIGLVLAGAPGMPELTNTVGEVAVEQGRADDQHGDIRSIERVDEAVHVTTSEPDNIPEPEEDSPEPEVTPVPKPSHGLPEFAEAVIPLSNGIASRRRTMAAQTTPALPLHLRDIRKPRISEDPFGQRDPPVASSISPFQSTPSLSTPRHTAKTASFHAPDPLQYYDFPSQMHMLRSHFCQSEVRYQ